jgi:hypothetical protein
MVVTMEKIFKTFNQLMILIEERNETVGDMTHIYEQLQKISEEIMEVDANYNG